MWTGLKTKKQGGAKHFLGNSFDEFGGTPIYPMHFTVPFYEYQYFLLADYKSLILPLAEGNVAGLLTSDFYDTAIIKIKADPNYRYTRSLSVL